MTTEDRKLCQSILSPGVKKGMGCWVRVMRNRALLLALPMERRVALATLKLYQPQKLKGRLLQRLFRYLVQTGVYRLLPKIQFSLGDEGLLASMQPEGNAAKFGFLLGTPGSRHRNLIGIVGEGSDLEVVKCAVGGGTDVVRGECALMQKFHSRIPGVPECRNVLDIMDGAAYVAEWVKGRSPRRDRDDELVFSLLRSWLDAGQKCYIRDLPVWKSLTGCLPPEMQNKMIGLADLEVMSPVVHGDFAPWNIKINRSGEIKVLDWESGRVMGVPGWDALHFLTQRMLLVEGLKDDAVVDALLSSLEQPWFMGYLEKAGLGGYGQQLVGSYLYYSGYVDGYPRKGLIDAWKESFEVLK